MRDDRGRFTKGNIQSEETKKKIGDKNKGHHYSPNTEFKNGSAPWNKGLKRSQVAWNKGKKCPQLSESKKGSRNPNFGKPHSDEWKHAVSESEKGDKNPFYGKKHSEETRNKISESKKGSEPWNKNRTGVYSKETIKKLSDALLNNPHLGHRGTKRHREFVERVAKLYSGSSVVEVEKPVRVLNNHWRIIDVLVDGVTCVEVGTLDNCKIEDLLDAGFSVLHYPY